MKCYYEELGVARDASDADIKVAYRKLALRWHPDKNPDNLDEAKERFQALQQAYEVLSDQHERAWYDNHREQILRGKNSDYEENCLDLFQYFTVSCFRGYGDDDKGFYKVYAEVFEKLAAEDAEFMDDEEEIEEIPKFGNSTSSYEDVVGPFYAYWQSYCTKKTYTWLCPYDITEIKDRRILREIEKDMKKVVQKARRERNEEVRNLVSFIRKRDKRVQANKKLLEERAALNRQKQEQNRLEQIRKRNRELEEMRQAHRHAFNDGYEEQLKQLEQEYGEEFESDTEEEQESESQELNELTKDVDFDDEDVLDYVDDLYCVACNRAFKNEKAFMNHETSKKHRENIERLKREMQEEDKSFDDNIENGQEATIPPLAEEDDLDDLHDDLDEIAIEEEKQDVPAANKKGKKNKKSKKAPKVTVEVEDAVSGSEDAVDAPVITRDDDESDDEWGKGKKATKKSKNKKTQKKPVPAPEEAKPASPPLSSQPLAEESSKKPSSNNSQSAAPALDAAHVCVTCKSTFESKNKLFAHLKKTNHGVYIPKANQPAADPQPTKKSKGKRK